MRSFSTTILSEMNKTAKMKYYAVKIGRVIGIFDNWDDCSKSVIGYKGAEYKSFRHSSKAKRWIDDLPDHQTRLDLWWSIDC